MPLSDRDLLELSGEASVEEIRDLNLRNQGLESIEAFSPRLTQLLALSLSHNRLTSMRGFHHLHQLTTLNVNSNSLTSLEGVQGCRSLQRLYAASNMIRDLAPLVALQQLDTVSM